MKASSARSSAVGGPGAAVVVVPASVVVAPLESDPAVVEEPELALASRAPNAASTVPATPAPRSRLRSDVGTSRCPFGGRSALSGPQPSRPGASRATLDGGPG